MKVKREMSSRDRRQNDDSEPLSGSSVHNRLGMGRSWIRAENRLDKNSRWNKRESPRKRVRHDDLRTKIKKTLDDDLDRKGQDNDQLVKFREPRKFEYEEDEEVLQRREKQLDYGKNTVNYDKYLSLVPKDQREDRMPRTPNKRRKYSRRQWDGMVKKWKKDIHDTVAALEDREDGLSVGSWADVGNSSTASWADEVDQEEDTRSRLSSTSTDLGLGVSMDSTTSEELKEEVF